MRLSGPVNAPATPLPFAPRIRDDRAMRRFVSLFSRHPILATLFLAAAALTTLFVVRSIVFMAVWSEPERQRQPVEPWMTPRYVALSWDVPRDDMLALLQLPPGDTDGRRETLAQIAEKQGISPEELIARIDVWLAERDAANK